MGRDHLRGQHAARAETVRKWVQQADIADGVVNGVSSAERQQIKDLQREVPGAAS
ncbi:MAG: hypothetical protein M3O70_21875 [Actinomycetota bacterium]|nr:hypothetical protein [Actinomycetota bacterium]